MMTRHVAYFVFAAAAGLVATVAGCSSEANPAETRAPDGGADEPKDPEVEPTDDDRDDASDAGSSKDGDATTPTKPQGYCPTASADEAIYCQNFDGPAHSVGTWTLKAAPSIDDAGVVVDEDGTQFWSPPSSRRLTASGYDRMLRGISAGPLPVKSVLLRFRVRPEVDQYGAASGADLAYVSIGDSYLSLAWVDYGRFDASKKGTTGYALVHRHVGSDEEATWAPVANALVPSIWTGVELKLSSNGTLAVAFDGVVSGQLKISGPPSTTGTFGFGPASAGGSYVRGNIDDVVAIVAR